MPKNDSPTAADAKPEAKTASGYFVVQWPLFPKVGDMVIELKPGQVVKGSTSKLIGDSVRKATEAEVDAAGDNIIDLG